MVTYDILPYKDTDSTIPWQILKNNVRSDFTFQVQSNTAHDRPQLGRTSCATSSAHSPSTERCAADMHQSMMRQRSCQMTRSQEQLQRAMPTTRAALQLAAAAHGIGEHRCVAQTRSQHCIQACASWLCATPAKPSTMLNHVDIEFVTSLIGAPEGDVRSRRRPARPRFDTGTG
jgi:hypothetical protein